MEKHNVDILKATYGAEFEFGDIKKYEKDENGEYQLVHVPEHLGKWEFCENEVINLTGEYRGIACDPQGHNPPVGGEINMMPSTSWQGGADRFCELLDMFPDATCSFLGFNHIHVRVPGLKDDVAALRNLGKWIELNQVDCLADTCNLDEEAFMKEREVETIFGIEKVMVDTRPSDHVIRRNLMNGGWPFLQPTLDAMAAAQTPQEWMKSRMASGFCKRYWMNINWIDKKLGTIEFRNFRASADPSMVRQHFEAVHEILNAALNTGETWKEIVARKTEWAPFPKLWWDEDLWKSFCETQYSNKEFYDEGKNRELWEAK